MGLDWRRRFNVSARSLVVAVSLGMFTSGPTSALETHPVEPGDTLASIAQQHGVSPDALAETNGLTLDSELPLDVELIIPGGDESVAASTNAVLIDGVPTYKQARSLSCEYASVFIATSAIGEPLPEDHSLESLPFAENPHDGYRGNIDGTWGNTDDYGIYAEPLASLLEQHGFGAEVSYGADASRLTAQLDAGRPTIVWISTKGDPGFYDVDASGKSFKLVPYMHVVVAYGYDSEGVYISDPGSGTLTYYDWSWFLSAWGVLDGMAVSVFPM